jgi:predicted nucleic acid-binding protein
VARRTRRALTRSSGALLLDAEGLSKAARDPLVRAYLLAARRLGAPVHVSAVTLAETLRGTSSDAPVHRSLSACVQEAVTPAIGRAAGELLGATSRSNTVDAVVAAHAQALGPGPVRILTSDPADLLALTESMAHVDVDRV